MLVSSRHLLCRLSQIGPKASRTQRRHHSNEAIEAVRSLPWQYLRAADPSNYDSSTYQRTDVAFDMCGGKPILEQGQPKQYTIENVSANDDMYILEWSDGLTSTYPITDIHSRLHRWKERTPESRILWSDMTEEKFRESPNLSIFFEDLITDQGMKRAITSLYEYGILLVTKTPVSDDGTGIAALGAALGGGRVKQLRSNSVLKNYLEGGSEITLSHGTDGPLRTLYGTVWSTINGGQADGSSVADSAYGNDALPLHTDMTYMRDPPGLQIFTMVQPAIQGGESVFADGFALASKLRENDPEAFSILSNTVRRYSCRDPETGWQLEASGTVIDVSKENQIVGIRHNDLDRLPDLPPSTVETEKDIDDFYDGLERAHAAWDSLISQDAFRLVMKLQPGDTMVVANQRCMHGRYRFASNAQNPRSVMGCYIGQDELYSRMRMEGFFVH